MILIELDARITVPQIVDAIDAQPRQGADVLIDRIQPRWRPRSTTSAAKNHWGDGRHPLMAYETGAITSVISHAGLTVLGAAGLADCQQGLEARHGGYAATPRKRSLPSTITG
jgi:hypothetical protein